MGDKDLDSQQEARDAVDAAYAAFGAVSKFGQAQIDEICEAMAAVALENSARLGKRLGALGRAGARTSTQAFNGFPTPSEAS